MGTYLGDDEDRLAGELLLELFDERALLGELLERGEHRDGDEDDDSLLAITAAKEIDVGDVALLERALELLRVHLELVDSLQMI